jgi:hypothetical protein
MLEQSCWCHLCKKLWTESQDNSKLLATQKFSRKNQKNALETHTQEQKLTIFRPEEEYAPEKTGI